MMNNLYQDSLERKVFQEGAQGLEVNSNAQSWLYSAKGWVRFLSVLGFISFALMLIGTLIGLMIPGAGLVGPMGGREIIFVLLFGAMTVITFMLSLRLTKFANAIGRLQITRQAVEFELAMIEQMKFWRLLGILIIIWLVLVLIGVFAGFVA